jgi:hypothetical protein
VHLEILAEVVRVEPADLLIRRPEFAGLVDVDIASLLGVRLAKLLADLQALSAGLEDTALAAEVGRAAEAERCGKADFALVQHMAIGIFGEIEHGAPPISLEALGVVLGKSVERRAVVW